MPLMTDADAPALRAASRIGLFFRLACDPPLCLWAGVGDCEARMGIVVGDETYLGIGALADLPELAHLINGQAEDFDFTLNGLDERIYELFVEAEEQAIGKAVHVGRAIFDAAWQIQAQPTPIWRGTAYALHLDDEPPSDAASAAVRGIRLSTSAGDTGQRRPHLVLWSTQHHTIEHPDDGFFDFTPRYQRAHTITWPRF